MVAGGMTSVGEFHYLHHQPDGTPYADPNAMSHALVEAAREAGIRITLLDTCYLSQRVRRAAAGRAAAVHRRRRRRAGPSGSSALAAADGVRRRRRSTPSARCPPRRCRSSSTGRPAGRSTSTSPSRSPRTSACVAAYGRTPTEVLADHGVLGPRTTAVHATHLTDDDIAAARRDRDVRRLLPDHRARPRRRHRARPPAARGGRAG